MRAKDGQSNRPNVVAIVHIPGDVPDGHPGLTQRVLEAIENARLMRLESHQITDDDGPHAHHWQPILYWCRGCGEIDDPGVV